MILPSVAPSLVLRRPGRQASSMSASDRGLTKIGLRAHLDDRYPPEAAGKPTTPDAAFSSATRHALTPAQGRRRAAWAQHGLWRSGWHCWRRSRPPHSPRRCRRPTAMPASARCTRSWSRPIPASPPAAAPRSPTRSTAICANRALATPTSSASPGPITPGRAGWSRSCPARRKRSSRCCCSATSTSSSPSAPTGSAIRTR